MKKFVIALAVIFLIFSAGIFIFISTFDLNKYEGWIEEKIEKAIDPDRGKDVELGCIQLDFLFGPALRIDAMSIKDKQGALTKAMPAIKAESVLLRIKLLPLIKRDIQIEQLLIKKIEVFPFGTSIENVELKAEKSGGDIIIHKLTGLVAEGEFIVKGEIQDIFSLQNSNIKVVLEDVNIGRLLPDNGAGGKPGFEGILSLDMDLSARGFDLDKLLSSLSAEGKFTLNKPVLKNVNILTAAFDKLNMLPGIVQELKDKLPERYNKLLTDKDTYFQLIKTDFRLKNGILSFENVTIESDAFYLVSTGNITLKGKLNMNSNLLIPNGLSSAFIDVVEELKYLKDENGFIMMPVVIFGPIPDIHIKPDLNYVLQRVIVSKSRDLIETFFEKSGSQEKKGEGEGSDPEAKKNQEETGPAEALIKTIFDIIAPKNKE